MDDVRAFADWLALREEVDARSRSVALLTTIGRALPRSGAIRILDLGTGAGSNLRYLSERLPGNQEWLVVDRSAALLETLNARTAAWAASRGETREASAGEGLVFGRAGATRQVEAAVRDLSSLDEDLFERRHLVTASALLDLASEPWLRAIASRCKAAGAAALFTITYDGRSSCTPVDPDDEVVRGHFNRHQKTNTGLGGLAAGPDAALSAVRAFEREGYRVERAQSDWRLGPGDAALQRQLIDGWAAAATEIAPGEQERIERWRVRRMTHIEQGRSTVVVGHEDMAATPGAAG